MPLWETLRTALNLGARVNEIERKQEEMRGEFEHIHSEWTDTLDLLRAREERQRKRDRTALKTALAEPSGDASDGPADVGDATARKAQLRRKLLTGAVKPHVNAQ